MSVLGLPEDELSGLKRVEDIVKFKILNIRLTKVQFVGLYYSMEKYVRAVRATDNDKHGAQQMVLACHVNTGSLQTHIV